MNLLILYKSKIFSCYGKQVVRAIPVYVSLKYLF